LDALVPDDANRTKIGRNPRRRVTLAYQHNSGNAYVTVAGRSMRLAATLRLVELLCQPVDRHWGFLRRPMLWVAATKSTITIPPRLTQNFHTRPHTSRSAF
jgi:hypothetical protein